VRLPAAITPKALYTIAIVRGAPHPEGATAFVVFLLNARARQLMIEHGLTVRPPTLAGTPAAVSQEIRSIIGR
jgi:ABC-type molybdate transport system substrate-binding protein